MIRETNVPNLIRVSHGVFENVDHNELDAYLKKRNAEYAKQSEVTSLKEQLNTLNTEMSDIKSMLQQLLRNS